MQIFNTFKTPVSIFIVWLFIVSALIGIGQGESEWFIPKTPLNLIIGAVFLWINFPINTAKTIGFWFLAFATGMVVEIIGVKTGLLFGEYYYGENLGPKLMGVPYLIGIYWAVLSFICAAIGSKTARQNNFFAALIGAALMVFLDVFIEQLAGAFDFWHFKDAIVPLKNYVTWFVVAFGLQFLLLSSSKIKDFHYSLHLYLSQLAFFIGCLLILD